MRYVSYHEKQIFDEGFWQSTGVFVDFLTLEELMKGNDVLRFVER